MAEALVYADDRALVERCLGGERSAERELYRRERGRVHATLYRVLGSPRDVDDLVQDTFLEVFRSLPRWRGEAKLATWIDRIAVRVAYRSIALRRKLPAALELVPEPVAEQAPADGRAHAREGLRRLYAALATLGAPARLAWSLHHLDARPLAEVAAIVGASVVTTKLRVWRAQRVIEKLAAADPVLSGYLRGDA
jgi:RNA polymerase sigma-70 factor (ECF subfamily)